MKTNRFLARTNQPKTKPGRLRITCATILLPLLLLLCVPAVKADLQYGDFLYTTNNSTVTITCYTGPGGAVTIPDMIDDLPVITIGVSAFYNVTNLTSVTIGTNVTSIGQSAFSYCTNLATITIPNSITNIGELAFSECTTLTSVTIPNSVITIGSFAFQSCGSLTNVTIGASATTIGERAFSYCTGLTDISIPGSVTSIGDMAFLGCISLIALMVDTSNPYYSSAEGVLFNKSTNTLIAYPGGKTGTYTIPNSVTNIESNAFYHCTNLNNFTIPDSVTSIGTDAFYGCSSLTSVTIGANVTSIGHSALCACTDLSAIDVDAANGFYSSVDGILYSKDQTTLIQCPGGKAGTYSISNGVTSIGSDAFYGCSSLTSVRIPDSVISIGSAAFMGCSSLTSVTIGNSVTNIGDVAFRNCTSLISINIPDSVTCIGDMSFYYCTSLTSINIGKSVTSIERSIFDHCTSLASVNIPNSVTNIGNYAFYCCSNLTSVTIGTNVTSIGPLAFGFCTSLTNITIPASVTRMDSGFYDCTSLTAISVEAFNLVYSSLDGVLFNKTQTTLLDYPAGKHGSYTVPNSVTSIRGGAFSMCASLTNVTIPNSVTNIADRAFYHCTNLTGLYFEGNYPSHVGMRAFDHTWCILYYLPGTTGWSPTFFNPSFAFWRLPYPVILNNGPSFGVQTNVFGFRISWATNASVAVEACTNLADPSWSPIETNNLIGGWSYFSDPQRTNYPCRFYRLRFLAVAQAQFSYTTNNHTINITYYTGPGGAVTIPNTIDGLPITSIGSYAFSFCAQLTSVTIPDSVSTIGDWAFSDCSSLTNVMIPNSVSSIGDYAFSYCSSITSVTIPNSVTRIGGNVFSDCTNLTRVYFKGNALAPRSPLFSHAPNSTIYYLPGTTGWDTTFSGRPTALWNPQVQTSDASFGVGTNGYGFTITGTTNIPILVEGCTNLALPTWLPLLTASLTNGSFYFSDPQWTNSPSRFYRLRSP